jgi:6-pyruvoyltetrahydropterin/6-carboxytetrahydropterin synthase
MNIVRLTKTFSFEMAHALYGYDGKCKNIHGHTYYLSVTVAGRPLQNPKHPKNGMVMDFVQLKKIVNDSVVEAADHALVLNADSPHKKLSSLKNNFEKIIFTDYQPTCENLLLGFRDKVQKKLPPDVRLFSMKLQETPSSYAEWFASDN